METLVPQVSHHLNDTLSPDEALIRSATRALDELSMLTAFPFSLIAIIRGEYDRGRKLAAATYLKNFISKVDSGRLQYSFANFRGEFRNQLVQTLLQDETEILRILVDAGECTRKQREEMKEQKDWEGDVEASTEQEEKDCTPMSKRK